MSEPPDDHVGDTTPQALMTESDLRIINRTSSGLPAAGETGRLSFVTNAGRPGLFVDTGTAWQRVDANDIFNIVDYGATPNDASNDRAAIQAAIDAAGASPRGGTVYVPPGEYLTDASLVLPRNANKPLKIRGAGTRSSAINASTLIASESTPVITYAWVSGASVAWQALEDITIARSNPGYVYIHSQPTDTERTRHCSMRNVDLRAGVGGSNHAVLHLAGALECVLENVVVNGGETGMHLAASSHVTLINFHTDQDHQMANGLRILGGGNHVLIGTRINAVSGGVGVSIEQGAKQIAFDGLYFEGKNTAIQLDIKDGANITVANAAFATPLNDGSTGLYARADAENVRVIGGSFADATIDLTKPNSAAVRIDAGARHVAVIDSHIWGKPDQNAVIASGAVDATVAFLWGDYASNPQRRFTKARGVAGVLFSGPSPNVDEYELFTVSAVGTVSSLLGGHEGKTVVLLATGTGSTFSDSAAGGNLRLASDWVPDADDTLELVFDGANWRERSRSSN